MEEMDAMVRVILNRNRVVVQKGVRAEAIDSKTEREARRLYEWFVGAAIISEETATPFWEDQS